MSHDLQLYVDGAWVEPIGSSRLDVVDPSTEEAFAQIALGAAADVDRAIGATRRAFASFGFSPVEDRVAEVKGIAGYEAAW